MFLKAKIPLSCLLVLVFMGCGSDPFFEPGVFGNNHQVAKKTLLVLFEEVKDCAELEGDFDSLRVELKEDYFECIYYNVLCAGEFAPQNLIKVAILRGWETDFKHEIIHYLLYLNYGGADSDHKSPLFNECV